MKFLKNSSIDFANIIFYTILVVFGTIPMVLFIIFGGLGILFTAITDPMAIVWTVMPYLIIGLIMWLIFRPSKSNSKVQSSRLMPRPSSPNKQQSLANVHKRLLPQTSNQFVLPKAIDKTKFPAFFESDGEIFKVFVENEMLRAAIFERKSSTFINVPGVLEITREGVEVSSDDLPSDVIHSLIKPKREALDQKLKSLNDNLIAEGKIKEPKNTSKPYSEEQHHQNVLAAMNRVAMEAENRERENRKKLLREKFIAALRELKEENESKNNTQPIELLGHKITQETHPKLYRKAQVNKPWLEEQILSIANKWQDGDVKTAINVFEIDLQHL